MREAPDPPVAPGTVRIRVEAAGVNFSDLLARQGLYPDAPKPPCVVGYEVAGFVDAVGPGVRSVAVGDEVIGLTKFNGQATKVVIREESAVRRPPGMTAAAGAALPVNYLTAHHMLFHIGNVRPGATVLVHMAAGGVGTAGPHLLRTV